LGDSGNVWLPSTPRHFYGLLLVTRRFAMLLRIAQFPDTDSNPNRGIARVISLLNDEQKFAINIYPDSDWANSRVVAVEVIQDGVRQDGEAAQLPKMKWDLAYRALAGELAVNEHQVAAMANGLDRGRTLRFNLRCRRSDLAAVGFLPPA